MTLHADLLEQAEHLAKREPKKPRQASLRRAVSAAYYALFHLLVSEGAKRISPNKPDGLKLVIQRGFSHGEMRNVCHSFVLGHVASINPRQKPDKIANPPEATRKLINLPLDQKLFNVTQAFIALQEARHEADYDLEKQWNRLDVLGHLKTARDAFADWAAIKTSDAATVFIVALLLQKNWTR
jgi:uncharacterized protein (UPF0332 family)